MQQISDVESYIKKSPPSVQSKLRELRALIKETAPQAAEKISYGMPFYEYYGRLVYFGVAKHHIGLYIPPPIITKHAPELKKFGTTKSAVHLPLDQDLPKAIVKKLITARMKWNEKSPKK